MPAVADRVQAEYLGVFVLSLDQFGELPGNGRPRGVVERGRIVHGRVGVQYAQRGVQMIEPRVNQAKAHHGPPEDLAEFGRGGLVGAEAVPGQHRAAGEQDVSFALVDMIRYPHIRIAAVAEPVQVGVGLPGALRVPEPRAQDRSADHGSAVGGEHHVREPGHRLDRPHVMAEVEVGLAEPSPLPHGFGGVGRLRRIHPRVNGVADGEVFRRAHQVSACGRLPPTRAVPAALPGDHEPRLGVSRAGKHASIMRVSGESLRNNRSRRQFVARFRPDALAP